MTMPHGLHRVRVWDGPTRLTHWLLALTVTAAVVCAQVGGNAMEWHVRLGLFALTLLAFRLVWGVVGPRWARFSSFVRGPRAVWQHIRSKGADEAVGHSPLGALSVLAMLAVLALQVASGLVADDEIATVGPLAHRVSQSLSSQGTWWHTEVGSLLVYVLVTLHLVAIVYYAAVKRRRLVPAMWHGDKWLPQPALPSRDGPSVWMAALLVWLGCAALAGWLWRLGLPVA